MLEGKVGINLNGNIYVIMKCLGYLSHIFIWFICSGNYKNFYKFLPKDLIVHEYF